MRTANATTNHIGNYIYDNGCFEQSGTLSSLMDVPAYLHTDNISENEKLRMSLGGVSMSGFEFQSYHPDYPILKGEDGRTIEHIAYSLLKERVAYIIKINTVHVNHKFKGYSIYHLDNTSEFKINCMNYPKKVAVISMDGVRRLNIDKMISDIVKSKKTKEMELKIKGLNSNSFFIPKCDKEFLDYHSV